jgi:hypothetical protein
MYTELAVRKRLVIVPQEIQVSVRFSATLHLLWTSNKCFSTTVGKYVDHSVILLVRGVYTDHGRHIML